MGYQVGLILATAFIAVMGFVAGPEGFAEWGWRVPFISSVILVGAGLIVRARVTETSEFVHEVEEKGAKAKAPLIAAFQENPKAFLQIFGLRLVELFTSYIVTTFALSYSTNTLHMDKGFMLEIGLIVGVVGIFTIPTFAILSDRFGRRNIYILSGLIGALSAAPFFISLEAQYFPGVVVFAILLVNVAHDLAVSVQQPLFADMFATRNRYSGPAKPPVDQRHCRRPDTLHRSGPGRHLGRILDAGCCLYGGWLPHQLRRRCSCHVALVALLRFPKGEQQAAGVTIPKPLTSLRDRHILQPNGCRSNE